jgi:ABC-2 type transport system ATP-binding protein
LQDAESTAEKLSLGRDFPVPCTRDDGYNPCLLLNACLAEAAADGDSLNRTDNDTKPPAAHPRGAAAAMNATAKPIHGSPMPAIEVISLTKWYGSSRGVEDVTFAVEPGEIFGYLGPNGSGKTTTIRCIMGLLRPTAGGVRLLGSQVLTGRATQHARIGYLPGDFRIWHRLSARRSLRVLAALGRGDGARARREQLAERLELNLDRPVDDLSKGNRQKVGVLYAFQHRPDVLILDEPTIGLDPLVSQVVLDMIREAADAGASVLLSSHDLTEVAAVCGRAAILREGRLVELASISGIVRQGERRLRIWFIDDSLTPHVPLSQLPGVRVVEQKPGNLHLAYQGSSDPILKWIARFPIDRIATPETSLQDAFMQYYRTRPNAARTDPGHPTPEGAST